jgi:hypothetical protein
MALRSRMALVFDGKIIEEQFEDHHVVNKYDAIVMNPPFGTAGRTAIDHLAKAATHLRDGGRIVALIPDGPSARQKFDKWFHEEAERPAKPLGTVTIDGVETPIYKGDTVESRASWAPVGTVTGWRDRGPLVKATAPEFRGVDASAITPESIKAVKPTGKRTETYKPGDGLYLVAEIKLPAVTFERAATNAMTTVLVIEKQTDASKAPAQMGDRDLTRIDDINELFDRIEDMAMPPRNKAEEVEPPSPQEQREAAKAEKAAAKAAGAAQAASTGTEVVEHTTQKGKVLKGVIRTDLSQDQAKEIDKFTWRKNGGYFIRLEHLAKLNEKYPPPGDPKFKASIDRGEPWYSELARALERGPNQAPAVSWKAFIKGLPQKGVKPDEIEWSGINEWLDTQEGKVPKQAVLDYLNANGVRVEETVLSDGKGVDTNRSNQVADDYNAWVNANGFTPGLDMEGLRQDDLFYGVATKTQEAELDVLEARWDAAINGDRLSDMLKVKLDAMGYDVHIGYNSEFGGLTRRKDNQEFDYDDGHFYAVKPGGELDKNNPLRADVAVVALAWGRAKDEEETDMVHTSPAGSTRYGGYTLPGGSNYREVLLTLPSKVSDAEMAKADRAVTDGQAAWRDASDLHGAAAEPAHQARREWMGLVQHRDKLIQKRGQNFRSNHWDQPNILAHIRVKDRTDAEGKRVLFVEEIQSDWAQKGKKLGFEGAPKVGDRVRFQSGNDWNTEYVHEARDNGDLVVSPHQDPEAGRRHVIEASRAQVLGAARPPMAPFVGKTDAWVALAIKRIVKMAVDEGYDRVAFVNGQQSADRYALEKHVKAVAVYRDGEGFKVSATDINGSTLPVRSVKDAAELEDVIGKDLASKAVADLGERRSMVNYTGVDLKMGGEGMVTFYDSIVPKVAKEVLRKLGGGQQGPVGMNVSPSGRFSFETGPSGSRVVYPDGTRSKWVPSIEEARDLIKDYNKQLGFDITPSMREKAVTGVPLFRIDEDATAGDTARREATRAPGSQTAAAKAVADLAREFSTELGRKVVLHHVDPGQGDPARRKELEAVATVARQFFRRDVAFLTFEGKPLFGGMAWSDRPSLIYLRADAKEPLMALLGHELLHTLRTTQPRLYDDLNRRLFLLRTNEGHFLERMKRAYAKADMALPSTWIEELNADIVGDFFMDPVFWQEMAAVKPNTFKSLADAIIQWLDDVIQHLTNTRPFGTEQYLKDINAARDAVVKAMRTFSERTHIAPIDSRSGFQASVERDTPATPAAPATLKPSRGILDTVLRKAGGEFAGKYTSRAYDGLLQILDHGMTEWAGRPYLYAKAGLAADYGLEGDYKRARSDMQTGIRKGTREAATVIEQLQVLDRAQSRVAHLWMQEKPDSELEQQLLAALPETSRQMLLDLKDRIDQMGKEAVRLGLLSQETYERNAMAYLHRSYRKYELDTPAQKALRARSVRILGDQFKGRGLRDDVTMGRIASPTWWGRADTRGEPDTAVKGMKFHRLENRNQPDEATPDMHGGGREVPLGRLRDVIYWPEGEAIPSQYADWRNDGLWEARFFDKAGKIGMWRDFTLDERTRMGEIQEVRYSAAKTMLQATRDLEVAKLLDWVAHNKAVLTEEQIPEGHTLAQKTSESLLRPYLETEWVKVPESTVPGTKVKRYGTLAGRFVPGPIWNDLRQVTSLSDQGDLMEWYQKALRMWKISKTALSPATHTNNVVSNFILADAHDIDARHMLTAARAWLRHRDRKGLKADPAMKKLVEDYQDNGGDGGKFNEGELREDVAQELLDQLQADINNQSTATARLSAAQVWDLLAHKEFRQAFASIAATKTAGVLGKAPKALIKLYGREDELFRLAAFVKAREDGLSDHDAGLFARESFIDYNINAPWIQAARRTVFPFIGYTYRAVPMMVRIAAEKPWKVAKWLMVGGALNALGYAMSGGDEDEERRLLPEEKAGKLWGVFPKLIRMPWNDAHDSPVFLDVRRWVPAGDVFDTNANHAAVPVPAPLVPGGPLAMIGEVIFNRQGFTGKDITKESDTLAEKYDKFAGYLWKSVAPNFPGLPGTYSSDAIANAQRGKTDVFGREQSLGQAALSSLGVKLASYPKDVAKRNLVLEARSQIFEIRRGIQADARQLARNGITRAEYDDNVARAKEKIQRIADELEAKVKPKPREAVATP